jgi:Fur family zinc uptake transcriptional regulator
MTTHGFDTHDHTACVGTAMAAAERYCADKGLQFTPVRRRVLEILLGEHRALGAYDILPILAEEGLGKQPPVIYRALDFLVSHGFVHKIERLNAYIACAHPGVDHAPAFMICRSCTRVVETEGRTSAGLGQIAKDVGFDIEATVVEAEGLCQDCRESAE